MTSYTPLAPLAERACQKPLGTQHANVNKRFLLIAVLLLAAILIWWETRPGMPLERRTTLERSAAETSHPGAGEHADEAAPLRTKIAIRESKPRATHSPERLREFMLPAMVIEGLTLDEALGRLMTTYERACATMGETPLPLTFSIRPPGSSRKLTLHLPAGNFNTSVQLFATLSGMKASRQDREYRLEPVAGERKQVSKELQVPLDLDIALGRMAGMTSKVPNDPFPSEDTVPTRPIRDWLTAVGLDLDPSTQVTLGASGKLTLETTSAVDAAAISALTKSIGELPRTQMKFSQKVIEIPAGTDWIFPENSQMTDADVETFMREMSQKQGVNVEIIPSITGKSSQNATVEMIREVIYQTDDSKTEKRDVGKVVNVRGDLLGFGNEMQLSFKDTTFKFDPSIANTPLFGSSTLVANTVFADSEGTRLMVQTKPDGSRTVLLVNSTIIDATGRPIR